MLCLREGLLVGLDQAIDTVDGIEAITDRRRIGLAGFLNCARDHQDGVIGIRNADSRSDIGRSLDVGILRLQCGHDLFARRREVAEEAVGLHEDHVLGVRTCKLGETAAGGTPVGDDRRCPAHTVK